MAAKRASDVGELVPTNMRLPRALIDALDAEVDARSAEDPYRPTSRSDLIRDLLAAGIRQLQADRAAKSKPAASAPKRKG